MLGTISVNGRIAIPNFCKLFCRCTHACTLCFLTLFIRTRRLCAPGGRNRANAVRTVGATDPEDARQLAISVLRTQLLHRSDRKGQRVQHVGLVFFFRSCLIAALADACAPLSFIPGSTVIPSQVQASVSFRIVPDQSLEVIAENIVKFIESSFSDLKTQNHLNVRPFLPSLTDPKNKFKPFCLFRFGVRARSKSPTKQTTGWEICPHPSTCSWSVA